MSDAESARVPLIRQSQEQQHAQQCHPEQPEWFSPGRLLALFCGISLLVYLDRGALSSNGVNGSPPTEDKPKGEGIQGDFGLSNFQDGLLPAAFMMFRASLETFKSFHIFPRQVGLLFASAAFAEATKYYNAMRLIGVGLAIWTASVVACAAAPGFGVLLTARALMGAGEASFLALAAPFIDDVAPPKTKTLWFATFYMTNTAGYALGYMVGGSLGPVAGWRGVFIFEALLMMPFVGFTLLAQPVELRSLKTQKTDASAAVPLLPDSASGNHAMEQELPSVESHASSSEQGALAELQGTSAAGQGGPLQLIKDALGHFAHLCRFRVFLFNALGQTLWTANVGALAYWGPKAARQLFDLGPEWVDLIFGALTAVTSVCGTLAGAALSDALGSSLHRSMLISGSVTMAAFLFMEAAFLSSTATTFPTFMAILGIGMFFLFGASGPSNAVNMWSVPVDLRPQAVSFSTIMSHLFGDVPSPPVLGWLQDNTLKAWDATMGVATLLILFSSLSFFAGSLFASPAADHRVTEPNPQHPEEAEQHVRDDAGPVEEQQQQQA